MLILPGFFLHSMMKNIELFPPHVGEGKILCVLKCFPCFKYK